MQAMNEGTTLTRTGGSTLELEVNAGKDCALFTTIPLEEGWTITVDGEPVNIKGCLSDSLMCIPVSAGKHKIVLDFQPAGLSSGLMLTASGMFCLAVMLLVSDWLSRRDKRHIQTLVKTEEQSESTMGSENSAEK